MHICMGAREHALMRDGAMPAGRAWFLDSGVRGGDIEPVAHRMHAPERHAVLRAEPKHASKPGDHGSQRAR